MKTVKNIYAVGFPSIIMQSIGSIMIVGLNGILAASEASVTVLGVYYKLQSFVFMPCFGLNQGVMPIIGYNYGARNRKRVIFRTQAWYYNWRNYYDFRHIGNVDNPGTAYFNVRRHRGTYEDRRACVPNYKSLLYSCRSGYYLYHLVPGSRQGNEKSYYVFCPSACAYFTDCVYFLKNLGNRSSLVRIPDCRDFLAYYCNLFLYKSC